MELSINSDLCGFVVEKKEAIPEFEGTAYCMRHKQSGARLLYLKNDDENKAFAISFKTPPADNTGVFHILEHSVLCGSKKFPVKEPFVHLLKSSMQTFLNAMTFPDKTMYPVASTNEQDLLNLMEVYLDAVFNPNIYNKPEIFEQEGWHYELVNPDDPLRYNGVVLNEMRGVLSSPDSVLYNAISAALFPDSAYSFESGGDPRFIPDLSYEAFLDGHRRHYRFDNSYIFLYGNMEVERQLALLDENYLSHTQPTVEPPNPLRLQSPVKTLGLVKEMPTAPENASVGLGYVVGHVSDHKKTLAVEILLDAILGSNEAPLKRQLLDAQLADDINGYLVDEQLQPIIMLRAKGIKDGMADLFCTKVEEALQNILKKGVSQTRLKASLASAEFAVRERDFGIADGVVCAMQSLSSWLYDDERATSNLKYEAAFADLHKELEGSYFDSLLKEVFLENEHMTEVELKPVDGSDQDREKKELAGRKAALNDAAVKHIISETKELTRLQELEDSPEAIATLPMLKLSDIGEMRPDPSCIHTESYALPCLHHNISARGINYVYYFFDLESLCFEDVPYLSILMRLFGKLDTQIHSAEELDSLINTHLGALNFSVEIYGDEKDVSVTKPKFVVAASGLAHNHESLFSIPHEICCSTLFENKDKIRDILTQVRSGIEQEVVNSGHSAAMSRVASYYSPSALAREHLGGVDFYRFLKDLLAHFDERIDEVIEHIRSLTKYLFDKKNTLVSFTGTTEELKQFWDSVGNQDFVHTKTECHFTVPELQVKNEAFIIPSEVCFSAKGYDRRLLNTPYTGVFQVANRLLSYDYLWNEVRVKGGAYGAGFRSERNGAMQFYSYRDPNLDATLDRFDKTGAWLTAYAPTEEEMRGYVISSAAVFDAPKKAREIARRQDAEFLSGIDHQWRAQARSEVLQTTPALLASLAPTFASIKEKNAMCVFGSKEIINSSKKPFEIVEFLS